MILGRIASSPRENVGACPNVTPNKFYTAFDKETSGDRKANDYRTPFERDRDRIIHSNAFRRLQGKTQVFTAGEYDFYRTRLTHTIEVSQIGRSICTFLNRGPHGFDEQFHIDPTLVEAVCLAHDIGHPPFGHIGERILNELMRKSGGFEANAQSLRLLTETIWSGSSPGDRKGMCPTRALLDGILKYKIPRSRSATRKKQFIYDDQKKYLIFVHKGLPRSFRNSKSIECQIMDWADEIAYSTADVVDGVHARFITVQKLYKYRKPDRLGKLTEKIIQVIKKKSPEPLPADGTGRQEKSVKRSVEGLLCSFIKEIENKDLQRFRGGKIGELIKSVSLTENPTLRTRMTNRCRYTLQVPDKARTEQECLSQIARDLVFDSTGLQQLQYKAQTLIQQLFDVLSENYKKSTKDRARLLSRDDECLLDKAKGKAEQKRLLCDYISGMSDNFVIRTCRRLTDPEFGSIADLV